MTTKVTTVSADVAEYQAAIIFRYKHNLITGKGCRHNGKAWPGPGPAENLYDYTASHFRRQSPP
jgi:hypothetical protein